MKLPAVAVLGKIRVPTGNTFMGEAVSPTYNFEEMKKKKLKCYFILFFFKKKTREKNRPLV